MAAIKRNSKDQRKTKRKGRSIFCFLGGCFGPSNRVSANHGDEKLSKLGSSEFSSKPVRTKDQMFVTSPIISPSKEVHVAEAEEKDNQLLGTPAHQVTIEQRHDMIVISPSSDELKKEETCSQVPALIEEEQNRGELESIFGALIILVILIVMLIWGKMCAIICTAAWFYFVPRFIANAKQSYSTSLKRNHIDLNSCAHKKKVVLQGLLERRKSA